MVAVAEINNVFTVVTGATTCVGVVTSETPHTGACANESPCANVSVHLPPLVDEPTVTTPTRLLPEMSGVVPQSPAPDVTAGAAPVVCSSPSELFMLGVWVKYVVTEPDH